MESLNFFFSVLFLFAIMEQYKGVGGGKSACGIAIFDEI